MTRASRPRDRRMPPLEAPARAARRRRLQALAGLTVHGSDGKTVGRVRDIYQQDATGELAAITVMPRQLSARSVLIPASAIVALPAAPQDHAAEDARAPRNAAAESRAVEDPAADGAPTADAGNDADTATDPADNILRLLVPAARAKAGVPPPLTLHATPEELRDAAAVLGLEAGSAPA
ncbi:PRC-barrel domain-containing protein [Brachybacterium sp.]|uniref:PRC-barrel domain-containing protein n=1 Tax=Brachybacterium sp. TaxID=1891286 RepID=UPI002ED1CF18